MSNKEKRTVKVTVGVYHFVAETGWNRSALVISDHSGDTAPREVRLEIERPSDIEYIRAKLDEIEVAWRKELDAIRVHVQHG